MRHSRHAGVGRREAGVDRRDDVGTARAGGVATQLRVHPHEERLVLPHLRQSSEVERACRERDRPVADAEQLEGEQRAVALLAPAAVALGPFLPADVQRFESQRIPGQERKLLEAVVPGAVRFRAGDRGREQRIGSPS